MAITRAQQFKQMLAQGGRIGLFRGAEADARAGRGDISPGTDRGGNVRGGNERDTGSDYGQFDRIVDRQRRQDLSNLATRQADDKIEEKIEKFRDLGSRQRKFQNFLSKFSPTSIIGSNFGPLNNRDFLVDKVLDAGRFNYKGNTLTKQQFANLTEEEKEDVLDSYLGQRGLGQIDAYGNPIGDGGGGRDGINQIIPVDTTFAQAPSITKEEEKDNFNFRLLAEGGRAGFQEGGIMPRLNQLGSGVSSAEQTLQDINQRLESAESSLGGGGVEELQAVRPSGGFSQRPLPEFMQSKPQNFEPLQQADPNSPLLGIFPSSRPENTTGLTAAIPPGTTPNLEELYPNVGQIQISNFRPMRGGAEMMSGIPAASYADGGNVVGGEYDFESARQMYGLGKLVKKVTRTVKKIAKSPVGKAAIGAALFKFGSPFIKSDAFKNFMFKEGVPGFSTLTNKGILAGIGGISALAGLMAPKEEDDEELYSGADIADPRFIMANPQRFQNIRTMAEGGSTEKEPVAKKTMPLLDMGGQEMDLRAEGGFVPIGRMEKADDVPARLSKNEFVFTADAVRNAGEGDVDKGAEVMYNMMKNLEAGGEVSEESQGLEGARKMFQTSQRLGEVL